MLSPAPRVAVVILNWNGAAMLRQFLPLVVSACDDDGKVFVADNGSTDESLQMLQSEFPDVVTIALDRNYGFAEGYNRALKGLEAEFYLLLNSDVEPAPHFLRPLLQLMDTHPACAACQPKLLSWRQRDSFEYAGAAGGFIDRYGYPFCRGRVFNTVERDGGQYDASPYPIFWATGAALLVRRTDWEAVGGLDGTFFAHQEEIDLCWRLRARSREVWCVSESIAYHVGGATLGPGNPRKTYLNFRNNLRMLYKNLPESELRHVMRWRCALDYVAALQMLLTGQPRHAAAVLRARRDFNREKQLLKPQREENLRLTTLSPIPEQLPSSLLWLYHARRKHTFAQLLPFFKKG